MRERICIADTTSLREQEVVIGVCQTQTPGMHHSLLLYQRGVTKAWEILHVNGDRVESLPLSRFGYRCVAGRVDHVLNAFDRRSLSSAIRKISAGALGRKMPYGFSHHAGWIAPNGQISKSSRNGGLTCSRFVLAVLFACGYQPVDTATWHRRVADLRWASRIIKRMMPNWWKPSWRGIMAWIEIFLYPRIRPEEVVGAAIHNPWPTPFSKAKEGSLLVLEELEFKQPVKQSG